jgi:hypothetical protein
MRRPRCVVSLIVWSLLVACGGHGSRPDQPRYVLGATGGTYNDGSGALGVAALATLRDDAGDGPAQPWAGTIADASGPRADVTYADPSSGSYAALWWHDVPFAVGTYGLHLQSADAAASASFSVPEAPPLQVPQLVLSSDGATLSWSSIPGAASFECEVATSLGPVEDAVGAISSCAVGGLPDGSYSASVRAYSTDLATISASTSQRPMLPARFDVSEARLAFLRAGSGPVVVIAAAGGAMDDGLGVGTLAVWLSILNADGSPPSSSWGISIGGPGIAVDSPITFTYPANFSRLLTWSYDQPAAPGLYTVTATSPGGTVTTSFEVGAPAGLAIPPGISASGTGQGAARVDWTAVAGAQSYLVSVWQGATFVTSQWAWASPANFPQGSFTSGQVYDVYVAATDADMVGGLRPTQVAVAENTFEPAGFTAP